MTTPTTVQIRLQIRADTAANWSSVNTVLLANELGLESDTKKFKIGNGSTAWSGLTYFPSIVSGGTVLGNLEIGTTGTLTFEGSTANGFETTLGVVDPTADRTILLPNQSGTVVVGGNASITNADIAANAEIAVSKLANGTANQVLVTDGTDVSWSDNLTLAGDLTVNGTTTTINTQDLLVEDKNVIIGNVDTPTDVTADGGGITLKGSTDKTINWVDSTDAWTSSERFSVPLGSASAPSLTFTGDENTGIYSPGADQVAISTNGTGRLFVDASGNVGVGAAPGAGRNFALSSPLTGSTTSRAFTSIGTIQSDVTAAASCFATAPSTAAASFTLNDLRHYTTSQGTFGAGSTVASQFGYVAASNLTGATNNYGFFSDIASGTGRWNFYANGTAANYFAGNVGLGTASPATKLHLLEPSAVDVEVRAGNNQSYMSMLVDSTGVGKLVAPGGTMTFTTGGSERARIDSSGRLLVGTSSARATYLGAGISAGINVESAGNLGANNRAISVVNGNSSSPDGDPIIYLGRTRSDSLGGTTIVQNGDNIGRVEFVGSDGTNMLSCARIQVSVDGTPGANDMPGRLVFSVTRDGSSLPTEALRIANTGQSTYTSDQNVNHFVLDNTNASYGSALVTLDSSRAANTAYFFLLAYSGNSADLEFNLRGDGNAFADGSWSGGGADYAEYFEWSDSNPDAEDRRGVSVVLDGDKIREALPGEDPIGVISGNPSVVGDAAWNKWSGKYLRDEFGSYIQEDYEVEDEDGNTVIQQRRKLNPAYDPDVEYISREQRPEWDCVGLMGKLRIRKGQATGSRWIKMRDINDSVEEWLVR